MRTRGVLTWQETNLARGVGFDVPDAQLAPYWMEIVARASPIALFEERMRRIRERDAERAAVEAIVDLYDGSRLAVLAVEGYFASVEAAS